MTVLAAASRPLVLDVHALALRRMHETPTKLVRKRLDATQIETHILRLSEAEHVEVRVKSAIGRTSEVPIGSFAELARQLIAGEIVAVQIRYFDRDVWWSDTFLGGRTDFRLVRMREGD
jgi:hypothetical protein